jgi:general secretion pathway protein F
LAVFKYIATDQKGNTTKGVLEGDSAAQIRQKLRDLGKIPVEVSQSQEPKANKTHFNFVLKQKIPAPALAMLTFQFATLINAGLTIEEALINLAEQSEKSYIKGIFLGVHAKIVEGHSLATALGEYPRTFPGLYRASVAAGERSGQLGNVLQSLADYLERQQAVQTKIQNAVIYPAVLTFVSISVVTFLLAYVVPKIVNVFINTGQALPTITIILLALSAFISSYGWIIATAIFVAIVIFKRLMTNEGFKTRFQKFLLRVPVIGHTLREINTARFSRTFGILFASSVPVLEAMHAANSVVKLLPMQNAIEAAINKVREGTQINRALQDTGYFSLLTVRLVAAGEMTGRLEDMLEKSADYQERVVAQKIDVALALFEPGMILLMGMIVLFIVLAIMLPIFEINQFVG